MGTYLITGATGGIGASLAGLLRHRGHDLVLTGRSPERLEELAGRLRTGAEHAATQVFDPNRATGGAEPRLRTVPLDLSEPRRLEAALAAAKIPQPLNGIVHAAGYVHLGTVAELDADAWVGHLSVNLASAAELTRLVLPGLRHTGGDVVFVNSTAGLRHNPNWSAYAASKAGLRALADSLRGEEPDIRVTTVYPGRTATEMQRRVHAQEGRPYNAGEFIDPVTVAKTIADVLETTPDAVVSDVTIRPR